MSPTLATRPRPKRFPQMTDRLPLGQTGLVTSPFCVGWVQDPSVVEAAFDAGVNFFFLTTDMHWPVYEGIRRGLAALLRRSSGVRDQIVVAATSYVTQPDFTYAPFVELLEAVPELQRIDVLVIGGAYGHEFATRHPIYQQHLRSGRFGARALGTTFHDRAAAIDAINQAQVDLAFVRCNPVHPGARSDLFPKLRPSPTRVFNFNSMIGYTRPAALAAHGITADHWRPRPTDYYRFALSQRGVEGLLCSLHHPREVRALERALRQPLLDDEEQRYMIDLASLVGGTMRLADAPAGKRRARP